MAERARRRLPRRIEWVLFDPLDGFELFRSSTPITTMRDIRRQRLIIMAAPTDFKPLGRPDGKPIGLRALKTRTRLVYHD